MLRNGRLSFYFEGAPGNDLAMERGRTSPSEGQFASQRASVFLVCLCAGEAIVAPSSKDDACPKLAFMKKALACPVRDCDLGSGTLHIDLEHALDWQDSYSPEDIIAQRELIISSIESLGERLWQDGSVDRWFAGCDFIVRRVSATVNGPLFQRLLSSANLPSEIADVFRYGTRCFGFVFEQ